MELITLIKKTQLRRQHVTWSCPSALNGNAIA